MREMIAKPHGVILVTGPDRLGQVHDALRLV
jgi:type II secretory ATPase GspE/PulE/Tfp pilus assembly ATPase PilB-like protein